MKTINQTELSRIPTQSQDTLQMKHTIYKMKKTKTENT